MVWCANFFRLGKSFSKGYKMMKDQLIIPN